MDKKYYYIAASIIVIIGVLCYVNYADTSRIQHTEQQLNNAGNSLERAAEQNNAARNVVTDSIRINGETERAITDAQHVFDGAKQTNRTDADIISESKRILENARNRAEGQATGSTEK